MTSNDLIVDPGSIDRRVVDQGEVWLDKFGQQHRIDDREGFDDDYLANVVTFLRRNAMTWAVYEGRPNTLLDGVDAPGEVQQRSRTWMETTVLMGALRAEADRRGLALPPAEEPA